MLRKMHPKFTLLNHINKKNCPLLPHLSDEGLHTLGEFIFNVITQRLTLNKMQLKKVKLILGKNRVFYTQLIDKKTKNPLTFFRSSLKSNPQVGNGIVGIIGALAPLIASLLIR